jgi:cephalosporin hydroxylase
MRLIDYSNCQDLNSFVDKTLTGLSKIYWLEYPKYIRQLDKFLNDCSSYRELGTNQGGSAAFALTKKLKYYELIDLSFKNFNPHKIHFDKYCKDNNLSIIYHEISSLELKTNIKTDFLLIDSVHKFKHVIQEIKIYEPLTNKYIMFHDTVHCKGVKKAIATFLKENSNWYIVDQQLVTPGYIVIKRK